MRSLRTPPRPAPHNRRHQRRPIQRTVRHQTGHTGESPMPLTLCERDYARGDCIGLHAHHDAQLIYASDGIMRIETPHGLWIVPPSRAVWVPPDVPHAVRAMTAVKLRTLYLHHHAHAVRRATLPAHCCVVEVSPLLRELILKIQQLDSDAAQGPVAHHAAALILDEIQAFDVLPLHLPMPRDPRLLKVCRAIAADPASNKSASEWGADAGASARTLERLFHREVGLSLGRWRQQARLLEALNRLATGTSVTHVALDLGYRSPSAFTVMFKRALGRLPSEVYA